MFRKKNKRPTPSMTDTLIGEKTTLEGTMVIEGSLRIEGKVQGDIETTGDITVGEKGILHSHLSGREITIAGKVYGNVSSKGKLTITKTGELHGNIDVQTLVIIEGGCFQGISHMKRNSGSGSNSGSNSNVEVLQNKKSDAKSGKTKSEPAAQGTSSAV